MTEAKLTSAKKLMAEKIKAAPKPAAKPKPKAKPKAKPAVKKAAAAPKPAKDKPEVAVHSASSMLKDFYSNLNQAANSALGS